MDAIPIYDATAPITCTASPDELAGRIEHIEALRSTMARIERSDDGLLLHFAPGEAMEADLRRFAIEEKGCCRFWGFEVRASPEDLTLRWDGPPDARDLMDRLHAWFLGDEPLTAESGLL